MKDDLKWKFGLRNRHYFNISKIGLKLLNLGKNALGDRFMFALA